MRAQDFAINIIGLSQRSHQFVFEFGDDFFALYGNQLIDKGKFKAEVILDKRETLIEGHFRITGTAGLICDRSLEAFDYPLEIEKRIVFKYGDEAKELSEEIVLITRDQAQLDVGQYLYELIAVNIPMKRLHPMFRQDDQEESDIRLVYSSPVDENEQEEKTDPRWEKLKKLK